MRQQAVNVNVDYDISIASGSYDDDDPPGASANFTGIVDIGWR